MSKKTSRFPFGALVAQDRFKLSLLLTAINPSLGPLLASGSGGSGKKTAVRALADLLPGIRIFDGCPHLCSPDEPADLCDRCRGMMKAQTPFLKAVEKRPPLIEAPSSSTRDDIITKFAPIARRGILLVHSFDLMDRAAAEAVLDAAEPGGKPPFQLICLTGSAAQITRQDLLGRFGLKVTLEKVADPEDRLRILKYRTAFESDPASFLTRFEPDQARLRQKISGSRSILETVTISDAILGHIVRFCSEAGAGGHQGDIYTAMAARTIAAFDGRKDVREDDVRAAIELTMPHRASGDLNVRMAADPMTMQNLWSRTGMERFSSKPYESPHLETQKQVSAPPQQPRPEIRERKDTRARPRKLPQEPSEAGTVEQDETSKLLIIVADTSGPTGVQRSTLIKSAIPEVVKILPGRSDRLALVTFRGASAVVSLPPTRDVANASRKCKAIQAGGKTPLPDGLVKAMMLAREEIRKDPGIHPLIAVFSDGRANAGKGGNIMVDLEEAAAAIAKQGFKTLVIAPEDSGSRDTLVKGLAKLLKAPVQTLEGTDPARFIDAVRELFG